MWLWLMRIATQYQLMMSMGNPTQCGNASDATWWPKLKLMQVATLGGQTCTIARSAICTIARSAIWWPKLELIQGTPPGGQNWNKCKWKLNIARGTTDPGYWVHNLNKLFQLKLFQINFSQKHDSSYRLNTLGPLCLWQCFFDSLGESSKRKVNLNQKNLARCGFSFSFLYVMRWEKIWEFGKLFIVCSSCEQFS